MPAIAPHSTATTDSAWDGPAAESNLKNDGTAAYYKSEFAWYDGSGDETKKSDYKFPHHMVSSDGSVSSANVKACVSAIAVLNGGMGGAKIPETDRAGVHAHVAKHLKDAGMQAAELKSERDYLLALASSTRSVERRFHVTEMRVVEAYRQDPVMIGHAAVFNQTADLGYLSERVAPGAFKRAVQEDDVRALWNHDPNHVLGRTKAGTLELSEDDHGLLTKIKPPDTQMGRDLVVSMKRGDVNQMSFGFTVRKHQIDRDSDGNILRTIQDVKLFDVSPVTYPAYVGTDIAMRSVIATLEELRNGQADIPRDRQWKEELEMQERELELARFASFRY